MFLSDREIQKYYRYALALTHHGDEAFDLVHEAFLKVRGRFFIRKDQYIFSTIKNLFLNRQKRKDQSHEELTEETIQEDVDLDQVMGDSLDVETLLGKLSPDERECILLIEVEGYTYKEVALLKGIKVGTLLSKLYRAKARLKNGSTNHE